MRLWIISLLINDFFSKNVKHKQSATIKKVIEINKQDPKKKHLNKPKESPIKNPKKKILEPSKVIANNNLKKPDIDENPKFIARSINKIKPVNITTKNNNLPQNHNINIKETVNNTSNDNVELEPNVKIVYNPKKPQIRNIIDDNNNKINETLIETNGEEGDDIIQTFGLPTVEYVGTENNTIPDYSIQTKLNTEGIIPKNITKLSNNQLIKPVTKNKNLQRKHGGPDDDDKYYIPIVEDGKNIKRCFSIHEDISIEKFLTNQGIDEYESKHIAQQIDKNMAINKLIKNQSIILILKKNTQYYNKHINNNGPQYSLKKFVIFFDNGFITCKWLENMRMILFNKIFYEGSHKNFFVLNCKSIDDFNKLNNFIKFFPKGCYNFFIQSIEYLINKHPDLKFYNIKLIFQNTYYNNIKKIHLRGFFIYTKEKVYRCYIFKDFANNYHLLNKNGQSCNLELLDLEQNPPVNGLVSSLCGFRIHPVSKAKRHHDGIDISAPNNTLIFATMNGWVFSSGYHKGYGNYIIISHGNNFYTLFAHLNYRCVSIGDYIENGRLIGAVGNTGKSTGNHLHYEIFESKYNAYSIPTKDLHIILSNRVILNPSYIHEIAFSIKSQELKYFKNLVQSIDIELKDQI